MRRQADNSLSFQLPNGSIFKYPPTKRWETPHSPGASLTMCWTISSWSPRTASCRMFHPFSSVIVTAEMICLFCYIPRKRRLVSVYHWLLYWRASRRSAGRRKTLRKPVETLLPEMLVWDSHQTYNFSVYYIQGIAVICQASLKAIDIKNFGEI